MSFTKVDEREKQAALEEEQARLRSLKVCYDVLIAGHKSTQQLRYTRKELIQVPLFPQ